MVNWKTLESYERLLAAVVAASDNRVDYKRVGHFFGQGATYDSIESRFRKAKKDAQILIAEAVDRPEPRSRSDKPSTPRKKATNGDAVKTGRVTKSTPKSTPKTASGASSKVPYASYDDEEIRGGEFKMKLESKLELEEESDGMD